MRIELDRFFMEAQDNMHSWQIRREVSARLPAVLERTKAVGSDLASLPPAADTIFRTYLEWEIANSIAFQKGYPELLDLVRYHYQEKLEREFEKCGYQSPEVTSHVFSPIDEIAKLLVKTDKFDPQTRQDLSSQVAEQVAEFHSRERNFHPLERQLQLGPPQN